MRMAADAVTLGCRSFTLAAKGQLRLWIGRNSAITGLTADSCGVPPWLRRSWTSQVLVPESSACEPCGCFAGCPLCASAPRATRLIRYDVRAGWSAGLVLPPDLGV